MLIFVTGRTARTHRLMAQVRDSVTTLDRPAAFIDAEHGWQADPVMSMRPNLKYKIEQLSALIDALWADGVRSFVIALPDVPEPERADQLARAAFWCRRAANQPAYSLDIDAAVRDGHKGTWTEEAFVLSIRKAVKALGPAQQIKPWSPEPPRYETERLVLSWPTHEQVEAYYHAIIGTDIFDTLWWNGPSSVDDLEDFWVGAWQRFARGERQALSLGIIEKSSKKLIGGCSLRPQMVNGAWHDTWDVGYALAKAWHGKGYATEAVRVLVDVAFRDRAAARVLGVVFAGNDRSARVLEKLGFTLEGTARSSTCKRGQRIDDLQFAVTRGDWAKGR